MSIRTMEPDDFFEVYNLYQDQDAVFNSWYLLPFFTIENFLNKFLESQLNFVFCDSQDKSIIGHLVITPFLMPSNVISCHLVLLFLIIAEAKVWVSNYSLTCLNSAKMSWE
ncbi:hypothetical protein [Veronia nyctiphanis]|uniref:hypothetical protein n=1 Tax=Veronia nyctiphanis TaxID=1278244 RepID=UPI00191BE168|nr:hypothetical protein [Veronia nyctiphanis]